ncbi:HtaA domain-containing protein [Demequina salsinemoris]|uniref:HtaA domain-containing protein n=1 Tax=Demequina salsinemoris TaxID=577470 RepID=UPI000783A780|nr:HtaA domain-containing protein [Demequina salsinemoris]
MAAAPEEGVLVWAVKESFVEYVEALGQVEVVAPATRDDAGGFRFPASAGGFSGTVSFRAHHGAMNVTLRDPRLEGDRLTVEYDDHGRPQGRIVLAEVSVAGRTALAGPGAVVFDFTYPVGTELAPIAVVAAAEAAAGASGEPDVLGIAV